MTTKKQDPCWSGYRQLGTKKSKKTGRTVPNCIPESADDLENEYSNEVDMVKSNLVTIIRNCLDLAKELKDGENLPEWVEEKISIAKSMINAAGEYMETQHDRGIEVYDDIAVGDKFDLFLGEECVLSSHVLKKVPDGIVIEGTAEAIAEITRITEAEYQGRKVPLNKPMRGDVKKSKVYVRNPETGKVIKVNFGDKNMRIKKSIPSHRKSFRARHNCDNPGPKTKARYWSCRAW